MTDAKNTGLAEPIETIKKLLTVRKSNGKEYYYLKFRFSIKGITPEDIDIYVCPTSCTEAELRQKFCSAKLKSFIEILRYLDKSSKRYITKYLTETEVNRLELLRLCFFTLKRYGESDLKRYEETVFTKYVQGTTSIEGNTYTLRETDLTLNEGLTVGGKPKREFYEIENYRKLKNYLDTFSTIRIDVDFIKKLHGLIMANIDDDSAGQFRRINVGIRGAQFEPQQWIVVEEEMAKLVSWHEENKEKMHPVELASIFHQKFEEIHPFKDGNGRVGREIMRLILQENGYPTVFIDMKTREEYLKSMDKGNAGDYGPLCRLIVRNMLELHEKLLERAKPDLETIRIACESCSNKQECDKLIEQLKEFTIIQG